MKRSALLGLLLLVGCTGGSKSAFVAYDLTLQDMQTQMADLERAQHTAQADLEILEDRLARQTGRLKEQSLESTRKMADGLAGKQATLSSQITRLTEKQTHVERDLRLLRKEIQEQKGALAGLEKRTKAHIAEVSETLRTVVALAEHMQTNGADTHTVRSGDTLGEIAQSYGVSISKIRQLNDLKGDRILPGQTLRLR